MSWNTLYISGKKGFKEDINDRLLDSDLQIMPGNEGDNPELLLYWVDDSIPLRELKKTIGSRLVFKYRLQFFYALEDFQKENKESSSSFTTREKAMIREMNEWDSKQDYLHSA